MAAQRSGSDPPPPCIGAPCPTSTLAQPTSLPPPPPPRAQGVPPPPLGPEAVGWRIHLHWGADGRWYEAEVLSWSEERGK